MVAQITYDKAPVVLVGAGQATPQALEKALTLADRCVAADGGAARALAAGVVPDAVIGDFDSVDADVLALVPPDRQHRITEQDSTDFEKALTRISAPVVLGVGFTGGRIDHELAAYHALVRYADRPCVLLGESEIVLAAPPRLSLPTQAGEVVSLFPLAPVAGKSTGLRWEIDGLAFDPARKIGTSNQALGPVTLSFEAPGMLLILPMTLIQPVVAAFLASDPARWPAP